MSDVNPYAPPSELPVPDAARPSLPEGIRRYGLDRDGLHDYVDKLWRGRTARLALALLASTAYFALVGPTGGSALVVLAPVMVGYLVLGALWSRSLMRKREPRLLHGYELLVSPRVLRRIAWGAAPAEILGPEVTSIVEVPDGLSLVSADPKHRLFVLRAVAGYAEIRDHVAHWRPIETRGGLAAWLRKRAHRTGEVIRIRRAWQPLAKDESIWGELDAVRALAMPSDEPSIRRMRLVRRTNRVAFGAIAFLAWAWWWLTPQPKAGGGAPPSHVRESP